MIDTIIERKINSLPSYMKSAIQSFPWGDTLLLLAKRYQIQIATLSFLEREIKLHLLGMISSEEFEVKIQEKLELDSGEWNHFISDINSMIFEKIREDAFRKERERKESEKVPLHKEIKESFKEEGLILIDEEDHQKPDTELQRMVDQLFREKEKNEDELKNTLEKEKNIEGKERIHEGADQNEEISEKDSFLEKKNRKIEKDRKTDFLEEEDYKGIFQHRIPTRKERKNEKDFSHLENLFSRDFIREEETISQHSFNKDEDDFLRHIGAI